MFSNFYFFILINVVISIIIIFCIHSLWDYLKDTYSTKKTRDLVNTQMNKYKQIINEIQENKSSQILSLNETERMDAELTEYLDSLSLEN